mmetsp:Transcript_41872/g.64091  ORF Transcript_41872/g.64091 Transcript_41872/m.64091 type:complete len:136 (+) Transcript_41872:1963-2370(+)
MVVNLFGTQFLVIDFDHATSRLFCFESFRDVDYRDQAYSFNRINLVASLPDNSKYLLFSNKSSLIQLTRKKEQNRTDFVYESWHEIKMSNPTDLVLREGPFKKSELQSFEAESIDLIDEFMDNFINIFTKVYNPF